jgi:DNA-binding LacI/PurR family transcriptional regulator
MLNPDLEGSELLVGPEYSKQNRTLNLGYAVFVETIQGVADVLSPQFDLMIAHSGYSLQGEEAAVLAFLSQRVCGIILHNTKHTVKLMRSF